MRIRDLVVEAAEKHPDWSHETLAKEIGCSVRTVYRAIGNKKKADIMEEVPPDVDPRDIKILCLDIETSLMHFYAFSPGQQYLNPENIIDGKDFSILCWAAKWLMDSKTYGAAVTSDEAMNHTDASVIGRLWRLLDEANVIVAHNAKKFDVKKINARFLLNGYPKPSPFQVVDTLAVSRKNFALSSHKLDLLGKRLLGDEKMKTGFNLWVRCDHGDQAALNKMDRYCRHDVKMLEDLFMLYRPWITGINLGTYFEVQEGVVRCPICLQSEEGFTEVGTSNTQVNSYKVFRCNGCQALGRSGLSNLTTKERQQQLRSI